VSDGAHASERLSVRADSGRPRLLPSWKECRLPHRVLLALVVLAMPVVASADIVAVLGTGRMGGALGSQFARHGHTVVYGSRTPAAPAVAELVAKTGNGATATTQADAVARAQIVVLALPWSATEAALGRLDLAGRLVIDPTNAVRMGEAGLMEMAVPTSGGELIQAWEPGAKVVKAFNTVGFHVVANPALANGPVSVPVAGDDAAARTRVAALVESFGLEVMDVGPMRSARALEAMATLYLVPYLSGRREDAFEFHLRRTAPPKDSKGVRPAG
jgi:predicted dinucleotide-binding enzyme